MLWDAVEWWNRCWQWWGEDHNGNNDDDDIYIMMQCLSVTKNNHFPFLSWALEAWSETPARPCRPKAGFCLVMMMIMMKMPTMMKAVYGRAGASHASGNRSVGGRHSATLLQPVWALRPQPMFFCVFFNMSASTNISWRKTLRLAASTIMSARLQAMSFVFFFFNLSASTNIS